MRTLWILRSLVGIGLPVLLLWSSGAFYERARSGGDYGWFWVSGAVLFFGLLLGALCVQNVRRGGLDVSASVDAPIFPLGPLSLMYYAALAVVWLAFLGDLAVTREVSWRNGLVLIVSAYFIISGLRTQMKKA